MLQELTRKYLPVREVCDYTDTENFYAHKIVKLIKEELGIEKHYEIPVETESMLENLLKWYIANVGDVSKYADGKNGYIYAITVSWIVNRIDRKNLIIMQKSKGYDIPTIGTVFGVFYEHHHLNLFDGYNSFYFVIKKLLESINWAFNPSKVVEKINQERDRKIYEIEKKKIQEQKNKILEQMHQVNVCVLEKIHNKYGDNEKPLLYDWARIYLFYSYSIDELLADLKIETKTSIYFARLISTSFYEKEIVLKYIRELAEKHKCDIYPHRRGGDIDFLKYYHGGEKNLLELIYTLLGQPKFKKNDLISALDINKRTLKRLFEKYDIRLPNKVYSPEGYILASKLERILEYILHKFNISHRYNVKIIYDKTDKRKCYIPDWRIRIDAKRTLIELFGYYGNAYRKRAEEKMKFYKEKGFNALALYKEDLDDEERLICKIENFLGVRIARV